MQRSAEAAELGAQSTQRCWAFSALLRITAVLATAAGGGDALLAPLNHSSAPD